MDRQYDTDREKLQRIRLLMVPPPCPAPSPRPAPHLHRCAPPAHTLICVQARRNREIAVLQRKIDEAPSRAELTQYQKRFLELYSQGEGGPDPLVLTSWSRPAGPDLLVQTRWSRPDGPDPLVLARWSRPDGPDPLVLARWF